MNISNRELLIDKSYINGNDLASYFYSKNIDSVWRIFKVLEYRILVANTEPTYKEKFFMGVLKDLVSGENIVDMD